MAEVIGNLQFIVDIFCCCRNRWLVVLTTKWSHIVWILASSSTNLVKFIDRYIQFAVEIESQSMTQKTHFTFIIKIDKLWYMVSWHQYCSMNNFRTLHLDLAHRITFAISEIDFAMDYLRHGRPLTPHFEQMRLIVQLHLHYSLISSIFFFMQTTN